MKVAERYFDDDGKLIIQETHDPNPVLNRLAALRSGGKDGFGESKHVGTVPGWLLEQWLRDDGVSFTDQEAVRDVIRRKMNSGEFSALRNWQGRY